MKDFDKWNKTKKEVNRKKPNFYHKYNRVASIDVVKVPDFIKKK